MFDKEKAYEVQKNILERIQKDSYLIREQVLDYYFDRYPDDEAQAREYLRGIRNYLDEAYKDTDYILRDLDNKLEY
ncbi:MAG: hypothetical protein WCF92_03280 [bacterium]